MKISVEKLEHEIHDGDWHDPAFRWRVSGPGNEVQHFYTKANAVSYRKFRRQSDSMK